MIMLFFSAWPSFSESLRGSFSVLRVRWDRQGAGSPALPGSVSDHPVSNDHPAGADGRAGMPCAASLKHLLLKNILQSDLQ